MTISTTRGALRRSARVAIAGAAILAAVSGASAEDAGLERFFSSIFGGGSRPEAAPAPSYVPPAAPLRAYRPHPLTVRLHKPKPRLVVAQAPTKPGKVSIFEDTTLRQGDAVMTAKGIRIFAGSTSWPYAPGDFVSLEQSKTLSKDTSKVLAQLDKLPRG